MVIKGFKKGYTLFEACVVMIIISIFIMVMANVIPHKVKTKVESNAHGHFECYYNASGNLIQQTFIEGKENDAVDLTAEGKDYCTFTPQGFTRFLILNAVGGGAKMSAGRFVSTFFNNSISNAYKIYIGQGEEKSGGDTVIKDASDNVVITAKGGFDSSDPANASVEDISSCVMSTTIPRVPYAGSPFDSDAQYYDQDYICDKGPLCEVENGMIKVSYCRTNELYQTSYLPYNKSAVGSATAKYRESQYVASSSYPSIDTRWDVSEKILTYCDTSLFEDYDNDPDAYWAVNSSCESNEVAVPSLYKMQLKLNLSNKEGESDMTRYIKMLQFKSDDAINTINPGDGSPSGAGNNGAVLILW